MGEGKVEKSEVREKGRERAITNWSRRGGLAGACRGLGVEGGLGCGAVCKSASRWLAGRPAVGLANQSHVIGPTNQLKTKYSGRRGHGTDFTGPTRFLRLPLPCSAAIFAPRCRGMHWLGRCGGEGVWMRAWGGGNAAIIVGVSRLYGSLASPHARWRIILGLPPLPDDRHRCQLRDATLVSRLATCTLETTDPWLECACPGRWQSSSSLHGLPVAWSQ